MTSMPRISVIVAFYKNFDFLRLVLLSLNNQKYRDFEVIIAEDDNNPDTIEYLKKFDNLFEFPIKHVWQEQKIVFQKTKILNRAIIQASGQIVVFFDGDIIVHRNNLQTYAKFVKPGTVCFGRRVMLDEFTSLDLLNNGNIEKLNFLKILLSKSQRKKYAFYIPNFRQQREYGILGCNWGIYKEDLLRINGFDEDYQTAGVGEDVDIEWRLKAAGIKLLSVRFSAITYHLYHKRFYTSDDENTGYKMFNEKKIQNYYVCKNGILKY